MPKKGLIYAERLEKRIEEADLLLHEAVTSEDGLDAGKYGGWKARVGTTELDRWLERTDALLTAKDKRILALELQVEKVQRDILVEIDKKAHEATACKEDPAWLIGVPSGEQPGDAWERGVNYVRGIIRDALAPSPAPEGPSPEEK